MREDYPVDEYGRPLDPQAYEAPPQSEAASPYYAPPQAYPPEYYARSQYGPPQGIDEAAGEEERDSRGKRVAHWTAWVLACVVIGVAIGAAIIGVMKFVNGPVTAKATADPLEKAREAVAPTPATNLFKGKQITLQYPSSFDSVGEYHSSGLDSYMISNKTRSQTTLALAVVPLTSMLLDDDSSYRYRTIHPELYSIRELRLGGEKAVVMTKQDKTEATLFWPHKGMDLNLSLTTSDPKFSPADVMNEIVPTIRWVQ